MEKEFVHYEQALELKELGFDEPCFGFYDKKGKYQEGDYDFKVFKQKCKNIDKKKPTDMGVDKMGLAPTFSQAFRWFREKYNLLGNVYSNASGWLWEIHDNKGGTHRFSSEWSGDCKESGMFTSFEKAELECLKKLISIVKEKQ